MHSCSESIPGIVCIDRGNKCLELRGVVILLAKVHNIDGDVVLLQLLGELLQLLNRCLPK